MNKIKMAVIALVAMVGMSGIVAVPSLAACTDPTSCMKDGLNAAGGSTAKNKSVGSLIKSIVNALLYVLGAIAVLMIVIGGIKYTTSQGDTNAVSSAKNTIMYAVIGLIVAILAYAIVNFVITYVK